MQKNSTDYIAKQAWDMTKTHWQELMLFPILVGIVWMALQALNVWLFIGFDSVMDGNFNLGFIPGVIAFLLYLAAFVFFIAYSVALLKWTEDIHLEKKDIDIIDGLRFGLTRFWATIWTMILTAVKVLLWMLLFIIPGFYKGVQYSFSIKVSQLEGVSGGDANRISQMLVMNSGFIRSIGNWYGIQIVSSIVFWISLGLSLLAGLLIAFALPFLGGLISVIFMTAIFIFYGVFMIMFKNFHYLAYREENQVELTKLKKALNSL